MFQQPRESKFLSDFANANTVKGLQGSRKLRGGSMKERRGTTAWTVTRVVSVPT